MSSISDTKYCISGYEDSNRGRKNIIIYSLANQTSLWYNVNNNISFSLEHQQWKEL